VIVGDFPEDLVEEEVMLADADRESRVEPDDKNDSRRVL
jgi:hypothetical protein